MKIKYPKKVPIGSELWEIKLDPKSFGGHFDSTKQLIEVGVAKGKDNLASVENFLHEVGEAIHWIMGLYYKNSYQAETGLVVMTHKEYQVWVALFTQAIRNLRITD